MKSTAIQFYLVHGIVFIITLACFVMNGVMREGLPLDNTADQRMLFILENTTLWSLSWFAWMLSALGLFLFCNILSAQFEKTLLNRVGLLLVVMGVGPDLIAEVIYAFIIPKVLHGGGSVHVFEVLETIATYLTGYLGNGLYNLGGMLLTLQGIRQGMLKSWFALWAMVAWTIGLLLSLCVALDALAMAEWATAISMVLSTTWMLAFAYKVLKP